MRAKAIVLAIGMFLLVVGVGAGTSTFVQTSSPVLQIAMLGDSITAGGVWHKIFPNASIANYGENGISSDVVLSRLDATLMRHPRAVFVMIGINDLAKGSRPAQVVANIKSIVERIKASGAMPIVQSTLHVGRNHQLRSNADVKAINVAVQQWCEKRHFRFVDLNKRLAPDGYLGEKYTHDGVHLTDRGYQVWADEIRSLVNQMGRQSLR